MKTILTRTAVAALAVTSLGFAACSAGVEAKPQDAVVNNGGFQSALVQTSSSTGSAAARETDNASATETGGVSAPGVTVGPGRVTSSSNVGNVRSADCDKDSVVKETSAVLRFSGHCDSITIDATGAVVYYDSVGSLIIKDTGSAVQGGDISYLEISGSGAGVTVDGDVNEVKLSGTGNAVDVSGTVGKVSDTGVGNAVN